MKHLVDQTKTIIERATNTKTAPHLLVGLSGGPDSVYLLHHLIEVQKTFPCRIIAAHLDHGWRNESRADAQFCEKLCTRLNIPYVQEHALNITPRKTTKGSQEALGRELRRTFFEQTREKLDADLIMLAHHQQDQQETFFIRMIRGATLGGLCSMKSIDGMYVRPLLNINKQEIFDYLHQNNISYLTDPSNNTNQFLRNRIRNNIIPAIKECDARFDQTFKQTLEALQEENNFLEELTKDTFQAIFKPNDKHKFVGNSKFLQSIHLIMQRRLILSWLIACNASFEPSKSFINEVLRFLHQPQGGCHQLGKTWTITKKKDTFWITHISN